jgi:hypothetical protein
MDLSNVPAAYVAGSGQWWRETWRARRAPPALSARLKAVPCELECVVQLAWRCVSDAFELHAGMEFIRTVTFGQLVGRLGSRMVCSGYDLGKLFDGGKHKVRPYRSLWLEGSSPAWPVVSPIDPYGGEACRFGGNVVMKQALGHV